MHGKCSFSDNFDSNVTFFFVIDSIFTVFLDEFSVDFIIFLKWLLFPFFGHGYIIQPLSRFPFPFSVSPVFVSPCRTLIGSSRHNTNSKTFLGFPSEDFGSCRHVAACQSHQLRVKRVVGRRKGRKRSICFHCDLVKSSSDHKGILSPVTEKGF